MDFADRCALLGLFGTAPLLVMPPPLTRDVVTLDTKLTFLCRADLLLLLSDVGKMDNIIRGFQLNDLPAVLMLSITYTCPAGALQLL